MSKPIIEDLTPEQDAKLELYYEKWLKIGLNAIVTTEEMRKKAEDAIVRAYKVEGLNAPQIIWTRSPLEGAKKCIELGDKKDSLVHAAGYGSHDAGWLAFYDFMRTELGLEDEVKDLIPLMDLAEICGWWWPYENVCVLTELPIACHTNESGDLHKDLGPSIAYSDGFCMYHLNGIEVSKEIVERPANEFTKEMILGEKNVDVRREIIRKIGNEKTAEILGADVIEEKYGYTLLAIDYGDKRARPHLKMNNPTIGTLHLEGVAPDCKTIEEAICYRNQLEEFSLPRTLDGKPVFSEWPDKIGPYDQQGDMLAFDFNGEIPTAAKLRGDNVAVDGLKRHIALGDGVKVYEGFIDAPNGCTIRHAGNDHGDMILAPGKYEVKRVLEYDHALEESRAVID